MSFKKILSSRGQSLAELGIFASLILFAFGTLISFGLGANYSQEMYMRSFRKNLYRAIMERRLHRPYSYIEVKDKRIITPEEITMSGSTRTFGGGNGTTIWSNQLYLAKDWDEPAAEKHIPRIIYVINDKSYAFTTASLQNWEHNSNSVLSLRRKTLVTDPTASTHWYWEGARDVNNVHPGTMFDLNGDNYEELLVKVKLGWDGLYPYISQIKYLDYTEGEVNLLVDEPKQGLLPSFTQTTQKSFSLNANTASTTESGSVQENFTRKIRKSTGQIEQITDANPEPFSLDMTWDNSN